MPELTLLDNANAILDQFKQIPALDSHRKIVSDIQTGMRLWLDLVGRKVELSSNGKDTISHVVTRQLRLLNILKIGVSNALKTLSDFDINKMNLPIGALKPGMQAQLHAISEQIGNWLRAVKDIMPEIEKKLIEQLECVAKLKRKEYGWDEGRKFTMDYLKRVEDEGKLFNGIKTLYVTRKAILSRFFKYIGDNAVPLAFVPATAAAAAGSSFMPGPGGLYLIFSVGVLVASGALLTSLGEFFNSPIYIYDRATKRLAGGY